jgi:hypothetical protein
MPKQVNIRVSEEMFNFIRSLPDGVEFIRQAIAEKRARDLNPFSQNISDKDSQGINVSSTDFKT